MDTKTSTILKGLVIERSFDASREAVWKAWTDPLALGTWWGPKHFTAPVIKSDLRQGGKYLFSMRGPDGKEFWSTGTYREIVPPERLVMTDSFADERGNVVPAAHYGMGTEMPLELLVTVTLKEEGGRTRLTLRHEGIPEGMLAEMTKTGWSESFDKLEAAIVPEDRTRLVAERGKPDVIVTRTFDAAPETLFSIYTDKKLIPQWWGPARLATTVEKMDVKQGGLWRIVQREKGREYIFSGVYHEVKAPVRVISTFEFEGARGQVSLDTVTFEKAGNKTRLIEQTVFQSIGDRDAMMQEGMEEGVYESMDRLAVLVAKAKPLKKAA